MHLRTFIRTHSNWQELLESAPYNLKIKWQDNYFICNYNMLASNFQCEEVCEARGSIFYRDENGFIDYVCRPFTKFFNYQEANAAEIDWSSAYVTEKIDGSLMKMWFHNGKWHLSTNGVIDAFTAKVDCTGLTFGQLFEKACGYSVEELGSHLFSDYTYCFELTSQESRLVIDYGAPKLWFLTSFNTRYGIESRYFPSKVENIHFPQVY